jgi:hypothetical protein
MISFGLRVYEWLNKPNDFWVPPWILTLVFLGLTHSIVFIYEFSLKTGHDPRVFHICLRDGSYVDWGRATSICAVSFYLLLYVILWILVLLKLNGDFPENWNWLYILTPAYLIVLIDVIWMGYVVVKAIENEKRRNEWINPIKINESNTKFRCIDSGVIKKEN